MTPPALPPDTSVMLEVWDHLQPAQKDALLSFAKSLDEKPTVYTAGAQPALVDGPEVFSSAPRAGARAHISFVQVIAAMPLPTENQRHNWVPMEWEEIVEAYNTIVQRARELTGLNYNSRR